jgi:hypothetical protein
MRIDIFKTIVVDDMEFFVSGGMYWCWLYLFVVDGFDGLGDCLLWGDGNG